MPAYSMSSLPRSCTIIPFISVVSLGLLFFSAAGTILNTATGSHEELAGGRYCVARGMLFVAATMTIIYISLHILVARRSYAPSSARGCFRLPEVGSAVVTARICLLLWTGPLATIGAAIAEWARRVDARQHGGVVAHLALTLALAAIAEANFIILVIVHETAGRPFDLPGITSHDVACRVSHLFPEDDDDGHVSVSRQNSMQGADAWRENNEKAGTTCPDLPPRPALIPPAYILPPPGTVLVPEKPAAPRDGQDGSGFLSSSRSGSSAASRDFADEWARLAAEAGYVSPRITYPPPIPSTQPAQYTRPRGGRPMADAAWRSARTQPRTPRPSRPSRPLSRSRLSTVRDAEEKPLPALFGPRAMRPHADPKTERDRSIAEGDEPGQYRVPGAFV